MSIRSEVVKLESDTVEAIVRDMGDYVSEETRKAISDGFLQIQIMLPGEIFLGIDKRADVEPIDEGSLASSEYRLVSVTHLGTRVCVKDSNGKCWCWVQFNGGLQKVRVPCDHL